MNHFTSKKQFEYLVLNGFVPRTAGNRITDKWYLSDLLEMLPMGASISKGGENFKTTTDDWIVSYEYQDENDEFHYKQSQHEDLIQAIIDMLVELKTNK